MSRFLGCAGSVMVAVLLLSSTARAQGNSIVLAWDQSPEPFVAGYVVYVVRSTDGMTLEFDAGDRTQFTYTGVRDNTGYSFSVAAYTADRIFGQRSAVVFYLAGSASRPAMPVMTADDTAPAATFGSRSTATSTGSARSAASPGLALACDTQQASDCYESTQVASFEGETITSMAGLPDGRVVVVDGGRRVRVVGADGRLDADMALAMEGSSRILSIVADPAFIESRTLYLIVTGDETGEGRTVHLVRYRELGGILGQPAVLVTGLPASGRAAVPIAVDASGRLLVALPAAADGARAPYASAVLRFEADGTSAAGNLGASPEFARGYAFPASLASAEKSVWLSGGDAAGAGELVQLSAGGSATRVALSGAPMTALLDLAFRSGGQDGVAVDASAGALLRLTVDGDRVAASRFALPDGQVVTHVALTSGTSILAIVRDTRTDTESLIRFDRR